MFLLGTLAGSSFCSLLLSNGLGSRVTLGLSAVSGGFEVDKSMGISIEGLSFRRFLPSLAVDYNVPH